MEYIELEVWKESRILVKHLYEMTREFPKDELYGLTTQMRRSAVSIPSNIAEGCGRRTKADTIQFLHVSRGSLYELETQLYLALDQNYCKEKDYEILFDQIRKCKKLLNGFINYYKNL
ncbi:four helix bundle protein [Aquimarina sp. 2201CG1-2-11]|uniref:four helix bundle protein n=1 Tax=Aquimarina discodermiae TaxID=3231043 RepID=UPI003462B25B